MPIRREAPAPQSVAIGNIGIKEGNVIEHQRFGIGTVIKVEGSGENAKATVAFKNAGTKQLLLKFAKYTIVWNDCLAVSAKHVPSSLFSFGVAAPAGVLFQKPE